MRAFRSMSLTFGLVSVPLKLYKAIDSHDVQFRQHHAGCGGHVGIVRCCKECGEEVAWADIVKGIDVDGTLVIVEPEELKSLEGEQVPAMEVIQFVSVDEIDPVAFESPYYLAPDKIGTEGYALIRQVLVESGRVALVRLPLLGREKLGVVRPSGKTLVLHTIAWPDEVREPAFAILDKPVKIKPKMLEMAHVLVDAMTAPFAPEDHVDAYTGRVREFVEAKASGGEFVSHPAEPEPAVDDLMAALEATIAKRKKRGAAA